MCILGQPHNTNKGEVNIPPGTYTLEFSLDGYGTKVNSVTVISAAETITVNVVLVAG